MGIPRKVPLILGNSLWMLKPGMALSIVYFGNSGYLKEKRRALHINGTSMARSSAIAVDVIERRTNLLAEWLCVLVEGLDLAGAT